MYQLKRYSKIVSISILKYITVQGKTMHAQANEDGRVNTKFLSIENPAVADATHLVECIKEAFHRIGIVDISSHLHGLNVDGASVNL